MDTIDSVLETLSQYLIDTFFSSLFQIILTFLGAFLGFGFSLWLYYLQTKKQREKDENKRVQHFEELLKYYRELLESIVKNFQEQLNVTDKFIHLQKENLTILRSLDQVAYEDFTRLRHIDNRGTFEAWMYNFKSDADLKQYKNTNSALDFLEGVKIETDKIFKRNATDCYEKLNTVKQIIDHIPDRLSSIAHQMANELGEARWENEIYKAINGSILSYSDFTKDIADFEKINSEYLDPLLRIFLHDYRDFMYSDEITLLCKKARVKLQDVRNDMNFMINDFEKIRERTEDPILTIKSTIEKIDNHFKRAN